MRGIVNIIKYGDTTMIVSYYNTLLILDFLRNLLRSSTRFRSVLHTPIRMLILLLACFLVILLGDFPTPPPACFRTNLHIILLSYYLNKPTLALFY